MMAVAQYLIYFVVGALYLFFIAAFFSVAAGFTIWALVLLFLPMFLAGYASGLSFFFPRVAAIASIVLVLPFFAIGIYHIFAGAVGFDPTIMVAPAGVVILVSVFALLWSKTSLWARQEQFIGKVFIGIFAAVPALLATLMIASTIIRLSGFQRAT
jgi:hypothetical protein